MIKITLSPAKLMNLETQTTWDKRTTPQFLPQSQELIDVLKGKEIGEIQKLMKLSVELAETNYNRYQEWNAKPTKKNSIQAALAFKGEVYRGLNAAEMNEEQVDYLQNNLMILSGLYGILRPMDKIMPYRLEMGTKLQTNYGGNLYAIWRKTLTEHVNRKTKTSDIIVNLASNEYFKSLDQKKLKAKVLDVDFYDYKNGERKKIMVFFKQARGLMARFCAENQIKNAEDLKLFNGMNYEYDEKNSSLERWVFIR